MRSGTVMFAEPWGVDAPTESISYGEQGDVTTDDIVAAAGDGCTAVAVTLPLMDSFSDIVPPLASACAEAVATGQGTSVSSCFVQLMSFACGTGVATAAVAACLCALVSLLQM